MKLLILALDAVMFVACVVGTVGEIVAGHWARAVLASLPTGLFLTLLIISAANVILEIKHV